jgi:hypothetical protein
MKEFKSASKANAAKRLAGVRKAYANGGAVSPLSGGVDEDDDPFDADDVTPDGPAIDGVPTRQRLDRPMAKKPAKTNIVINVNAGKPDGQSNIPPIPPVVPPNVPPIAGTPPPPPMMPPVDPSMMQRKNGGRVPNVKHAAGGGLGRMEKAKAYGETPCKGK